MRRHASFYLPALLAASSCGDDQTVGSGSNAESEDDGSSSAGPSSTGAGTSASGDDESTTTPATTTGSDGSQTSLGSQTTSSETGGSTTATASATTTTATRTTSTTGSTGSTSSSAVFADYPASGVPVAIPDDDPGGVCVLMDVPLTGGELVLDVRMTLAIDHAWLGDLSAELEAPGGSVVVRLFETPGFDGGAGAPESSDLSAGYPIVFRDDSFRDPNQMGENIQDFEVVCRDDGWCDYSPMDPFATFAGVVAGGVWTLCLIDNGEFVEGVLDDALLSLAVM